MAKRNANTELNHDNWNEEEEPQDVGVFVQADNKTMESRVIEIAKRCGVFKMTVYTSKSKIQTCLEKKLTKFDENTCRDEDKFPVNFSGVPDIGDKIFGCLDFKDLKNCHSVCKGWQNFLQEKGTLWIELLKEERFKLEPSLSCDSDDFSDCSDDSLDQCIGEKMFGFLDFKDLNNCYTVCKGWHNFLKEKRTLWIQLLKKEKIKLDKYADYDWDTKLSDCSDDSFNSYNAWLEHINEHNPDNMYYVRDRNPMDMCQEKGECNHG